jgi:hypothetical protein
MGELSLPKFCGRVRVACLAAGSLLLLAAPACSGESSEATAGGEMRPETTTVAEAPGATTGSEIPAGELTADDFDPSLFDDDSAAIDNEWIAFEPGKRFVWRGWTEEDEGERIGHRIVFTVTDLTKVIGGVRALVGWDRDYSAGQLVETELIFLAQDRFGNVWHLGQYSETWEEGEFVGGQAWLDGLPDGAKAGIWVKADPQRGTPAYSQGFAPEPYFWDDYAKVLKMGQKTCVPVGCFEDVLVVGEFEPTKPGAHQLKYYARGVGNVRVGWAGTDPEKEVLVLQRVVQLSPEDLAQARAEALKLETRAYVYGQTPPLEPWPSG